MTLIRELGVMEVNRIVNQDDILPFVSPGRDYLDLTGFMSRPGVFALAYAEVNGCLLIDPPNSLGEREVHMLFSSRRALVALTETITWLFTRTETQAIFGAVPRENRAARLTCRWLGCSPVQELLDGMGRPCIVYRLTREQWATSLLAKAKSLNPSH